LANTTRLTSLASLWKEERRYVEEKVGGVVACGDVGRDGP
jgi:hypothetical protein